MVAKKKVRREKTKYNFQKIDYPDPFWNYQVEESVDNNIVFLKKLKSTKWEKAADGMNDLFKCFTWEMSRTRDNPSDLKSIENARKEILKYKEAYQLRNRSNQKDLVNAEWLRNKIFLKPSRRYFSIQQSSGILLPITP